MSGSPFAWSASARVGVEKVMASAAPAVIAFRLVWAAPPASTSRAADSATASSARTKV